MLILNVAPYLNGNTSLYIAGNHVQSNQQKWNWEYTKKNWTERKTKNETNEITRNRANEREKEIKRAMEGKRG